MKRSFITFSDGELNDSLVEKLSESISIFSKYSLKVFRKADFDVDYDTSNPEFWKSGFGYIYKVLSCIKSLEYFDEVVWIDTDCIVTNYIDKIWFEGWRLDSFPLLPRYRFSVFGDNITPFEYPMDKQIDSILSQEKVKIQIPHTDRKFYSQACFIFFNKSCLGFFNEVLDYFDERYDTQEFPYQILGHAAFGDESIINYLLWKYNYTDNLGEIFLCSYFFDMNLISFIMNRNREDFFNSLFVRPENNIFENILFLHGNKNISVIDELLKGLTKRIDKGLTE